MSQYPAEISVHLPSHHGLLVRVLADIRRARRRIVSLDHVHDPNNFEKMEQASDLLYKTIMTLEMELNFTLRRAISKMEEEE